MECSIVSSLIVRYEYKCIKRYLTNCFVVSCIFLLDCFFRFCMHFLDNNPSIARHFSPAIQHEHTQHMFHIAFHVKPIPTKPGKQTNKKKIPKYLLILLSINFINIDSFHEHTHILCPAHCTAIQPHTEFMGVYNSNFD